MSIGDMRHEILLQEQIMTPDGVGGVQGVWHDLSNEPRVFSAMTVLSPGERFRFRQLDTRATHRFLIRYRVDIKEGLRVVQNGKFYRIFSVSDPGARRRFLEVLAEEVES